MALTDVPFTANLPATDIARARRWYEEKLGLTPTMDLGLGGLLYTPGGSTFTLYETSAAGTGKQTVGAFVVRDLEATMRDLRARGVTFEEYALGDAGPTTENGIARDPTGGAAAWFTDSEGNIIAITELPPGMSMPGVG